MWFRKSCQLTPTFKVYSRALTDGLLSMRVSKVVPTLRNWTWTVARRLPRVKNLVFVFLASILSISFSREGNRLPVCSISDHHSFVSTSDCCSHLIRDGGLLYNYNHENCDLCDFSITWNYCFQRIPKGKQHRRNEHLQELILTLKQKRCTNQGVSKTSKRVTSNGVSRKRVTWKKFKG